MKRRLPFIIAFSVITAFLCGTAYAGRLATEFNPEHLRAINRERTAHGLQPVTMSRTLNKAIGIRAKEQTVLYGHSRPDGTGCWSVLDEVDPAFAWSPSGENCFDGPNTVKEAMEGWMNSNGHRANILSSECTRVGVGTYIDDNGKCWWVQMFSRNAPDEDYYGEDDGDNNGGWDGGGDGTDPGDGAVIGSRIPKETITTGLTRVFAASDGTASVSKNAPAYGGYSYIGTAQVDLSHPEANSVWITLTFPVPSSFGVTTKEEGNIVTLVSGHGANTHTLFENVKIPKDNWIRFPIGSMQDFFSSNEILIYTKRGNSGGHNGPTYIYEEKSGCSVAGGSMLMLLAAGAALISKRRKAQ